MSDTDHLPPQARLDATGVSVRVGLKQRLMWLMLTRVILSVGIGLSFVFLRATSLGPIYSDARTPIIIITFVTIYLCNLAFIYSLGWVKRHHVGLAFCQLAVDCIGSGWLIHLTGGLESPLIFLLALYVTMGAIALHRQGAWFVVVLCSGTLALLCVHEITHIDFERGRGFRMLRYVLTSGLYQFGLLSFIAMLTSYLSEQVRAAQMRLSFASADMKILRRLNEHLLMSVYNGIIYCDPQGQILIINQAAERLLGRSANALINIPVQEVFRRLPPQLTLPALEAYIHATSILMNEGVYSWSEEYELENVGSDVMTLTQEQTLKVTLNVTLSRMSDETHPHNTRGWVFILQDITLRKRLEAKNERREHLASLGEIAAQIAHEVRNPLAGMLSSLELLRGRWSANSSREMLTREEGEVFALELRLLGIIEREALRINQLTESFLNFSRPPQPQPRLFDITTLVDEIALLKSDQIQSELIPGLKIYADPNQVRQILWNLFRNAWEAKSEIVEITAMEQFHTNKESELVISIADRGVGFDESLTNLDEVFKPFFSQKEGGTGLGLALCRSLAEGQGGNLEVRRRHGGGAIFLLTFPQGPITELKRFEL
jgi:two-component system sensor histidine kinase PilS (NtrC family)